MAEMNARSEWILMLEAQRDDLLKAIEDHRGTGTRGNETAADRNLYRVATRIEEEAGK